MNQRYISERAHPQKWPLQNLRFSSLRFAALLFASQNLRPSGWLTGCPSTRPPSPKRGKTARRNRAGTRYHRRVGGPRTADRTARTEGHRCKPVVRKSKTYEPEIYIRARPPLKMATSESAILFASLRFASLLFSSLHKICDRQAG